MEAVRPLRADAERNRRRVLDAARLVFARDGLDASVDEVARVAGVGVGTLYRRFPTKEQLLEAVLEDGSCALRDRLAAAAAIEDPWESFVAAAGHLAEAIATDKGLFQEVQRRAPAVIVPVRQRLREQLAPVLERAQAAGVVRDDVVVADVPPLCAVAARLPQWRLAEDPELWRRYLGVVLDGLRPEAATPLPHPAPKD